MTWRDVLANEVAEAPALKPRNRNPFTAEQAQSALRKYQDDSELWNRFVAWLSQQADHGADADWICSAFQTMENIWTRQQAPMRNQGAFGANGVSRQGDTDEPSQEVYV